MESERKFRQLTYGLMSVLDKLATCSSRQQHKSNLEISEYSYILYYMRDSNILHYMRDSNIFSSTLYKLIGQFKWCKTWVAKAVINQLHGYNIS